MLPEKRLTMSSGRGSFTALTLPAGLIALSLIAGAKAQTQTRKTVIFGRDIAPIIYQHCASCHRADGPAPFSLVNYSDAKNYASLIAATTRARSMPPWLPEPGYGDFADE